MLVLQLHNVLLLMHSPTCALSTTISQLSPQYCNVPNVENSVQNNCNSCSMNSFTNRLHNKNHCMFDWYRIVAYICRLLLTIEQYHIQSIVSASMALSVVNSTHFCIYYLILSQYKSLTYNLAFITELCRICAIIVNALLHRSP